jgi:homoserine kinase
MFDVKVPATSANLGPGFDCMGLAVCLYNHFRAEFSDRLEFELKGKYTRFIAPNKNNILWKSACALWRQVGFDPQPLKLTIESYIPPTRGLGSSSTAVIAGLLIANAAAGYPLNRYELLKMAATFEGHPDNVTPALYGGITLTVITGGDLIPRVLSASPKFKAVAVVPDFLLETKKSRGILPAKISRRDVIFNASRVGLLVDCFIKENYELLKIATQDRLHQSQRAALIPGMSQALSQAVAAGAYGAVLSGSGPALLAFSPYGLEQTIAEAMQQQLARHSLTSEVLILDIDGEGAVITEN